MKVYVVLLHFEYEGNELDRVFAKLEAAKAFIHEEYEKDPGLARYMTYVIEEREVIK